jgi:hypothetical protein
MKRKWLTIGIILLSVGTSIVSSVSICNAESNEYYFENVNVLIIGRCRNIGSDGTWVKGLFIGNQSCPGVEVTDSRFERIRVTIFNESIFNPWTSFPGLINTIVFMRDAKGIFFWASLKQFSARLIPSIVFVSCHTEKVWIRCA